MQLNNLIRQNQTLLVLLLDCIGIILAFNIAYIARFYELAPAFLISQELLLSIMIIIFCFYLFDLYNISAESNYIKLSLYIITSTILSATIMILIVYATKNYITADFSLILGRFVLFSSLIIFIFWASLWRLYFSHLASHLMRTTSWVILGMNQSIFHLINDFETKPSGKLIILSNKNEQFSNLVGSKLEITTDTTENIDKYINNTTKGIIITDNIELNKELQNKLIKYSFSGTRLYNLIEFYEKIWKKIPISHLDDIWFSIASNHFPLIHNIFTIKIKRLMDITLSAIVIIITSPILLLAYLAIIIESRGGAFFYQARIGLNNQPFNIYKFRTMHTGSEKGNMYTEKNDTRITKTGYFLRKTRIDELPQLFNVLKGDMSLIGPRPEWTRCVNDYIEQIPHYQLRHYIKPGISGWAQVNYPYGASVEDAQKKLQYDLYYIKNYSFWLDIQIVLKTIKIMLFGKGR